MKKLLFAFTAFLLFSCSNSDDDNGSNSSNSDFHPPAWIQGTWIQEGSTASINNGFSFSSSDLCTLLLTTEQCQKGLIDLIRKSGQAVTVNETITSTSYTAKITYYGGQSVTYSFRKLSNTSIEYMAVSGSVFIKQ
ncbi:hypothetical protein [Flavobacterium sp. ZB4P13]|uniref:hypothetical protein n=1 Tax=Flavobacterium sp. ZB4P13 TaxID=3401728 RepID=UPI003AAE1689